MNIYSLVFTLLLLAVGGALVAQRVVPLMATEYPPPGEAAATEKIIGLLKERLEKDFPAPERMQRDAHPKQHGLVKAEFTVSEHIPEEYRVGVFAEPRTFHAWIRYSNLSGQQKPDISKDSRGMAIKLMGVEGEKILPEQADATTHDFVFMSTQIFVTKDVKTFGKLLKSINGGKVSAGVFFLTHLGLLKLFASVNIQVADMFDVEWGSTTPYLLDDRAVKYAVLPQTPSGATLPTGTPSDNYLRERMVQTLKDGAVYLDFYIQVQTDAVLMPIEDPRVEWSQDRSPFVKVATIKVLQQTFDTPEQQLYGDQLSFTPWHALPVHRPMGGLNRGRRAIYDTMSKFRHTRNGEVSQEPTDWKTFE